MPENNLNTLFDQISEILSDNKLVKFNTHGNRRVTIKKIQNLVKEAFEADEADKKSVRGYAITHPNPNKDAKGYSIMTESLSSQGDENLQKTLAKQKAGIRSS